MSYSNKHHLELAATYKNPALWSGWLGGPDNFDFHEKLAWLQRNWTFSIYASIVYLIFIFGVQELMKNRKPFDLRIPLAIWNLTLAAISIYTCTILIPELYNGIEKHGIYTSICGTIDYVGKKSIYWGSLFMLFKLIELGDTVFIVLRKRKLIFLHWYHHITVFICVWYSAKDIMSTGAWFATVNTMVHALMYTYFGLMALRIKVPKIFAMGITTLQVNQMLVGLGVNFFALWARTTGRECAVSSSHIWLVFGMYLSYFILFGKFFYNTYLGSEQKIKKID